MTRILQIVMAGLLCCVMAFTAAAQDKGGHGKGGGKQPSDIPSVDKGGKGGNGGQDRNNNGNDNRGGNQDGKGGKNGKGGKRP